MAVKVWLEDGIIVKTSALGPDFLVIQSVWRPGCVATENQGYGLRSVSPKAYKFISGQPTGESLGGVD